MKLLLVADLHYTLRQWDWLSAVAGRFDLVVIAGDLLDIGSIVPLDAQIVVIRKYLQQIGGSSKLLVSSGNHDVVSQGEEPEKTAQWLRLERSNEIRVDGDYFELDQVFFSLLPWWETREDIADIEAQLEEQAVMAKGKRWVWIYHPPARKSAVAWNGRDDWGDDQLPRWMERHSPEMILGGHVHQAPFVQGGAWIDEWNGSWLFNSGRQPGSVPTFTVIDTDLHRAVWVSAEDAEQVELKTPIEREVFQGAITL